MSATPCAPQPDAMGRPHARASLARSTIASWLVLACVSVGSSTRAGAAFAKEAGAAEAPYRVSPECPTREVWIRGLRERLPPLLKTHPLVETLSVYIERQAEASREFVGSLVGATRAAEPARSVAGATCEEVLEALTFVAALALERWAAEETASAPASSEVSPEPVPPITNPEERRVQLGVVAFALWQSQLTPGRAYQPGFALRLSWTGSDWQPLFLVGGYWGGARQSRFSAGASVRLEHWSSQLVGCPWRFPSRGSVALRPCLDIDVGRSIGEGFDVIGPTRRTAAWLSAGAQLRAELELWDRLALTASVAGIVPLLRARFLFIPEAVAYETPSFGLRVGGALSALF
jgi:hypothetical protein